MNYIRAQGHRGSCKLCVFSGFSLIELLVVIAIIALLLSILMPVLGRTRSAAMRLKCAHNLRQIDLAVNMYINANNDKYPCAQDPVSTEPFYWLWMGRGWRSFVEPYLTTKVGKDNPSVLFCPQDRSVDYESTSYAYSMAFYHSPEQINNMNSPTYTCGNGPFVQSIPQRSSVVARPCGKILIGEWNSNHLRVVEKGWYGYGGWWCWEGSRNYLFADGQVQFLKAEDIRPANDGYPNPNLTTHGIRGIDWPR